MSGFNEVRSLLCLVATLSCGFVSAQSPGPARELGRRPFVIEGPNGMGADVPFARVSNTEESLIEDEREAPFIQNFTNETMDFLHRYGGRPSGLLQHWDEGLLSRVWEVDSRDANKARILIALSIPDFPVQLIHACLSVRELLPDANGGWILGPRLSIRWQELYTSSSEPFEISRGTTRLSMALVGGGDGTDDATFNPCRLLRRSVSLIGIPHRSR